MKKPFLSLIILIIAVNLFAQEALTDRQIRKAQRKAHRDSVENAEYQLAKYLVESRKFVLEADFLEHVTGGRTPVTSNLNFIKVDSLKIIAQTSENAGVGSNGIGGATAEGNIIKWSVRNDEKHKSFFITIEAMSNRGLYSVTMEVSSSGKAKARLFGIGALQLIWDGNIVPIQLSRVFKGKSI
jgi:hypothetical protein